MRNRSYRFAAAALIVSFAALATHAPANAQTPALVTVRVAATPDDDCGPILYAQKAGLFAKVGLDIVLEKSTSGTTAATAVLAGSYDIAKSSLVNIITAHVKGIPFTIIAPSGTYDNSTPFAQLLVLRDSPIMTAKDLNGKVLSTPALHDIGQVADSAWVEKNGGDVKSLKFIEFPMAGSTAALEAHRIDATTVVGPGMDAAMATGKFRSLGPSFGAIAPHFLFSGWFTTKEWADKHPDVAKKFAAVWAQAAAYVNAHHEEMEPALATFMNIPLETLHKMTRGLYASTINPRDLQPLIDAAVKYQMIDKSFPAQDIIDPIALTK